jgi:hypothetical protein
MGKGRIGLLLLEPSGILKSIVIDRNSLKALHTKVSIPRKELREELSRHGITVSDVLLIARQVAGILESKDAAGTPESRKGTKALTKIREEISEKPELSAMQKDEILERFRKDLAVIDEQAVTKQ